MPRKPEWLAALLVLTGTLFSDAQQIETQTLASAASTTNWSPAESEITIPANAAHGVPALRWHIAVDYFSGEPKYPVGWPRVSLALKGEAPQDWSSWDFLEFNVFTKSSRTNLPHDPVTLAIQAPDRDSGLSHTLNELEIGTWKHVRIPVAGLRRRDAVRSLQFSISESKYRHGDTLDLYFDRIALTRYSAPTLLNLATESRIVMSDARTVALRFELLGVKQGNDAEITFAIHRGDKTVARAQQHFSRGPQRIAVAVPEVLAPGDYQLKATCGENSPAVTADFRVISSPFK